MKNQTIRQLLESLNIKLYVDWEVAESSPKKIKGKLEFFNIGKYISNQELEKEYKDRNLVPADLYTLCEYAKEYPDFADEKSIAILWKDKSNNWCYAAFGRWGGERDVRVHRLDDVWRDGWGFAGLRKYGTKNLDSLSKLDFLSLEKRVKELEKFKEKVGKVLKL